MKRLLLCAAGTRGDVHPLVGIAAALKQRGNEPIILANEVYAPLAAEIDVAFEPVGTAEEMATTLNRPEAWSYRQGWRVWLQDAGIAPMRRLYRTIKRLHQPGKTVLAASYLCCGAHVARDALRIPSATLHLNVHTVHSIHSITSIPPPPFVSEALWPRSLFTGPHAPSVIRRATRWVVDRVFFDPVAAPAINDFLRELNLPPLRLPVRDWWTSPDLAIGLFPTWWAGDQSDWPPQMVTTHFPLWDRSDSAELPEDLEDFLGDDQAIVYSPGASSGHTSEHFAAVSEACATLNRKGIIITPQSTTPPRSYDGVHYTRYAPFGQLLPRTTVMLHHAGIGTTACCLAAGVPQILTPTLYNTPDTAIRLERLCVGRIVDSHQFTSRRLVTTLEELLNSPTVVNACNQYREAFSDANPLPNICQHLERL